MKPSIIRVKDGRHHRWVIADGKGYVSGTPWHTLSQVKQRWEDQFGRPAEGYLRVAGGERTPEQLLAFVANLEQQLPKSCRVCGCTEDDCRQCVEKTGHACRWVEPDLCSACVPSAGALKLSAVAGLAAGDVACLGAVGLWTLADLSRVCDGELDRLPAALGRRRGAFGAGDIDRIAAAVSRHFVVGAVAEGGAS